MSDYNSNYNQLGEEILFNLQPSVSDKTDQSQLPVSIEQSADTSVQSNGTTALVIGGLVLLYFITRQ